METLMKENIVMENSQEKVFINGKTTQNMKDSSRMEKCTGEEYGPVKIKYLMQFSTIRIF